MTRPIGALLLAAALVATNACGPSAPLTPSPTLVTENFSGTVQIDGTSSHPFTVTTGDSPAFATLTAAGPPATIVMGLGIGGWTASTSTCTLISGLATPAGTIAQLQGFVQRGTYCVQVFDVGTATTPIAYTVKVEHY